MEKEVRIKFGRQATDELKELVSKAKEKLLIVSPWLSSSTVKLALERQENNVNVRILTTASTDDSKFHFRALGDLIEKKQRVKRKARPQLEVAGLAAMSLGVLGLFTLSLTGFLSLPLFGMMIASIIVGGVLFSIGRESSEDYWTPKVSDLTVLNATPLLHAKIYVIDDLLAIGSPNFTYTGLNVNIEALAFIKNKRIASKVPGDIYSTLQEYPPRVIPLEEVWKTSKHVESGEND